MMVLQALRGPDEVLILYTLKDWRKQPEGVNESQLKFLTGTWRIYRN
jgi:hypothetical protein